jgi:hypothetical protein
VSAKKKARRIPRWVIAWDDVFLTGWDSLGTPWWGDEDEAIEYITREAALLESAEVARRARMTVPTVRKLP